MAHPNPSRLSMSEGSVRFGLPFQEAVMARRRAPLTLQFTLVAAFTIAGACGPQGTAELDVALDEVESSSQPLIGTPPQILGVSPNMASALGGSNVVITGK